MHYRNNGKRCTACFEMRLELVAEAAVKYGYDYFGSALTLSFIWLIISFNIFYRMSSLLIKIFYKLCLDFGTS
jgi:hypothetical protein